MSPQWIVSIPALLTACILQVTVKVSGTQATAKVPYTYKSQATRVDGLTMPVETGVDGIFKGVQVVDIQWEATDKHGAPKALLAK